MKRRLLCLTASLLLSASFAQGSRWTVQTAAFQDYRQASSQVEQLLDLGFDAYTEFAMSGGQQYARVRIGCFEDRAAAEAFAQAMRGSVTADAAAQPLSEGAVPRTCVEWDVGFLKPQVWSIERNRPDILFRVELGDQVGYLRHAGAAWQFTHTAPATSQPPVAGRSTFGSRPIGGVPFLQARLEGNRRINACVGELLWQSGLIAVVERPEAVIACRVKMIDESPPAESR